MVHAASRFFCKVTLPRTREQRRNKFPIFGTSVQFILLGMKKTERFVSARIRPVGPRGVSSVRKGRVRDTKGPTGRKELPRK